MNLYQFLAADEEEQVSAFWDGVFVGERTEDGYTIVCHQHQSFYIEVKLVTTEWMEKKILTI